MLLILNRACPDSRVAKKIIHIFRIFRIKHFIRAGKTGFLKRAHMQFPNSYDTLENIGFFVWIRLMEHTLVTVSGRSGLIRINARNDKNFILYLFLNLYKSGNIVEYTVLIVRGARSDYKHQFVRFSAQYILGFNISRFYKLCHFSIQRIHLLDFHWNGKLSFKHHIHH